MRASGPRAVVERLRRHPWAVAIATWALGALVFFRDPFTTGFDTITGERGDARLVVFLHEHWWRVWQGRASWRSPPMFHPTTGTLGYSDTFVANQFAYAPLRLIGTEPFVAFQLSLVALTAVGYLALVAIMRRHLGLGPSASCLLALVPVFANNVYIDTGHPQLYATNLIPLALLLVLEGWRAGTGRGRAAASAGGGLVLGLLLWSNFYFGWFAVLLGSLVAVAATLLGIVGGRRRSMIDAIRARWQVPVAAAGGLAVGLVPFLATYLPVLGGADRRTYEEVAALAPRPGDVLNVGRDNLVWGWVVRPLLDGDERLDLLHRAVALTPALIVTVAVAAVGLGRRWRRDGRPTAVVAIGLAAAATTAFAIVLPIQFGVGGLWAWVHRFVPGGSALRVYGRIEVVNGLVATLAVACWLAGRAREPAAAAGPRLADRRRRRAAAPAPLLALLALLALEQLNTVTNHRRLDRSEELAMLDAVPPPPEACRSFHVTDATRAATDHTLIDGLLIAHRVDLPTLNGYSGQEPDGWDLRPWLDDYPASVARWAERHGLEPGLCGYETTTRTWSTDPLPDSGG